MLTMWEQTLIGCSVGVACITTCCYVVILKGRAVESYPPPELVPLVEISFEREGSQSCISDNFPTSSMFLDRVPVYCSSDSSDSMSDSDDSIASAEQSIYYDCHETDAHSQETVETSKT